MNKKRAVLTFAAVSLATAASPVSFQTHYISLGTQDTSIAILTDTASNVFIVSNIGQLPSTLARVTKTDPRGTVVAVTGLNQGPSNGAALDPQGNILVVGRGFAVKLDNALANILATSSTGGTAVTTDASGNVYVAGTGAQSSVSITELSPDLATVIHQTSFGSGGADCDPISDACRGPNGPGLPGGSQATAIAIDPSGSVVVAGNSSIGGVPLASQPYSYGFVEKFSADLSSFLAEVKFDPGGNSGKDTSFQAMALDPQGNVLVVGNTNAFDAMPGATLQQSLLYGGAGIVLKYDNALQNLIWETYFGSEPTLGVAVDLQGSVWITGSSAQYLLPKSTSSSIANMPYVAQLTPDGTGILNLISSQFGGQTVAAAPNGTVAILGSTDSFLLTGPPDQPSLLMVANSANNQSSGTIAPIELISLFGTGIGPDAPLGGVVVDGVFTNSLGGYQVLFNGVPAPLLYAGPNQINLVSPSAIANQPTVNIEVVGPAGTTVFPTVFVAPVRPQIFSQQLLYAQPDDPSAVLLETFAIGYNQNGTLNSVSNPAPIGSIVTIWATGTGLTGDPLPDGSTATSASTVNLPIAMTGTQVLYAGQAPGAIQGLTQIDFQVPAEQFIFGPKPYPFNFQLDTSTAASAEVVITAAN